MWHVNLLVPSPYESGIMSSMIIHAFLQEVLVPPAARAIQQDGLVPPAANICVLQRGLVPPAA